MDLTIILFIIFLCVVVVFCVPFIMVNWANHQATKFGMTLLPEIRSKIDQVIDDLDKMYLRYSNDYFSLNPVVEFKGGMIITEKFVLDLNSIMAVKIEYVKKEQQNFEPSSTQFRRMFDFDDMEYHKDRSLENCLYNENYYPKHLGEKWKELVAVNFKHPRYCYISIATNDEKYKITCGKDNLLSTMRAIMEAKEKNK